MISDITDQVTGNTTYIGRNTDANWLLKAGAADTGLTHLIVGEKFFCHSTLFFADIPGTLNFISGLFLLPTTTVGSKGCSYTGTVNKLSAYFEGDTMIATDKKLYLEGALSGNTLTMGDTYMVFNSAAGTIDFYINGSKAGHIDSATGFVND